MMAVVMHLGRIAHVSRSEGLKPRARDTSTKQSSRPYSCLYGSETWVVPDYYLRQLSSFHSRVAFYLTGKHIRKDEFRKFLDLSFHNRYTRRRRFGNDRRVY